MEQHFDRASKMADAVKSEYEYTLRLRGEAAAYRVLESKGSTGNDFATIMVRARFAKPVLAQMLVCVWTLSWRGMSLVLCA